MGGHQTRTDFEVFRYKFPDLFLAFFRFVMSFCANSGEIYRACVETGCFHYILSDSIGTPEPQAKPVFGVSAKFLLIGIPHLGVPKVVLPRGVRTTERGRQSAGS